MPSPLRVMAYNIFEGGFGGGGRRLDLVAGVIRAARPDVLAVCEAQGLDDPRKLVDLAAAVGLRGIVAPAASGYHLALLTRLPHAALAFTAADVGGLNPVGAGCVRVAGLGDVDVIVAHLDYRSAAARHDEASAICAAISSERPCLVLGDFNAISHQDGLSRRDLLSLPLHHVERHVDERGELDSRATRSFEEAGFVDAWRALHADAPASDGWTVPTGVPIPPHFGGMRIDYILASAALAPRLRSCEPWRVTPAERASDHYPIVAELALDA